MATNSTTASLLEMLSGTTTSPTSFDSTDSSSNLTKYGDSDLSSKKRKPNDCSSTDPNDDSFYAAHFSGSAISDDCNSTLTSSSLDYDDDDDDDDNNKSTPHKSTQGARKKRDHVQYAPKLVAPITTTPSDVSLGLDNTFTVLERHLEYKYSPQFTSKQIQYLLRRSRVTKSIGNLSQNLLKTINEEVAIDSHGCNDAADESADCSVIDEAEHPSLFELELEASQRIRRLFNTSTAACETTQATSTPQSPLNELLYGFSPASSTDAAVHRLNEDVTEDVTERTGEYPEYVYHVAKGPDNRLYLRVVRSLLVDKVLCSNRVSQMTRTYDDIEAVTRLLEEKEKDLELTVQIGKELLAQNSRLESRVADLETELKISNETVAQLTHELHQKSILVAALTDDDGSEIGTPSVSKSINLDLLQRKISTLEEENKSLRAETTQLVLETDEVEEQERKLMADITSQLNSTNYEFDGLRLELERHKEENRMQHEQIVSLTARLREAEMRLHQLTAENEEQISQLCVTRENQNSLANELVEFKLQYQELLALLQEAQEQMRRQKKRTQPMARSSIIPGFSIPAADSLQSELMETSMFSDNSLDSGIAMDRGGNNSAVPGFKKVFETYKFATKNGNYMDSSTTQLGSMSMSSSYQPRMASFSYPSAGTSHLYKGPSSAYSTNPTYTDNSMGAKSYSRESLMSDSDDSYPAQAPSGVPGCPGAKDLEAALKKLTPAEVLARRAMLQHAPAGTYSYDEPGNALPLGIRTPDSIMSTGSSGLSASQWRLPDKLQIVKPMEGSQTLHHWNRLATPTLSGLLEERPGVTIRCGRGLDDLGLQIYSLSDVEEDVDDLPGKQFQQSGCVYTYTNSTVLHPEDLTAVTFSMPQSQMSSHVSSACTSRQSTAPPTPRSGMSRRNSCSTFSVNMGIASVLNERGIKAVNPSAFNTPAGPNFSPTSTPCNSPEGRSPRSRSPEPLFASLLSSGAEMLRRKIIGDTSEAARASRVPSRSKIQLSRQDKRAMRSLRLVEKVESLGLENIIAGYPVTGVRSRNSSPMTQLTSLKRMPQTPEAGTSTHKSQPHSDDPMRINRDTIRAVLSKGLSCDSLKSIASDTSSNAADVSGSESSSSASAGFVSPHSPKHQALPTQNGEQKMGVPAQPGSGALDARIKQIQRQKSRRTLANGGGQRPDLGKVGPKAGNVRPDLGRVAKVTSPTQERAPPLPTQQQQQQQTASETNTQTMTQSFVGSISSLFFGRKGGLL